MRRLALFSPFALLIACAAEEPPPPPPPPPPPTFTDFAGHWMATVRFDDATDSVQSQMVSRPDGGGWMLVFPNRDSIPMRGSMSGDSLVLLSEPYESVLQRGVTVQARSAVVLTPAGFQGRIVATYNHPDSQQVRVGAITGSRAPH
jgi:hypothetical protein